MSALCPSNTGERILNLFFLSFFRAEAVALRPVLSVRSDRWHRCNEDVQDARPGLCCVQRAGRLDQRPATTTGLPLLQQTHGEFRPQPVYNDARGWTHTHTVSHTHSHTLEWFIINDHGYRSDSYTNATAQTVDLSHYLVSQAVTMSHYLVRKAVDLSHYLVRRAVDQSHYLVSQAVTISHYLVR